MRPARKLQQSSPPLLVHHATIDIKVPRLDVLNIDVRMLQEMLESGSVKSSHLVDLYLAQIQRHDGYLHGMLSMPPRSALECASH